MKLSFQRGSSTHLDKVYRVKQVPNWHTSCYPFPMLFDKRRTLQRKGENCTLESAQHERESGSVDLEKGLCKELKLWNVCNCWPNQTNWPWWAIHNHSALEPFIIVLFLEVWEVYTLYIQRQKRSNQGCCFCPNSIYVFFFFHLDMLDLFCSSKRQDNAKSSEPGSYKAKDNNENTIICGALSIEMIDINVCLLEVQQHQKLLAHSTLVKGFPS